VTIFAPYFKGLQSTGDANELSTINGTLILLATFAIFSKSMTSRVGFASVSANTTLVFSFASSTI
ncbi:hypothetical protein L7Q77_33930, partial [Pseudomonas aeruginosa]